MAERVAGANPGRFRMLYKNTAVRLSALYLLLFSVCAAALVFYVTSLWGIGLVGGYWVTNSAWAPAALQGAQGYWAMSTAGLVAAGVALCAFLAWVHRREAPRQNCH